MDIREYIENTYEEGLLQGIGSATLGTAKRAIVNPLKAAGNIVKGGVKATKNLGSATLSLATLRPKKALQSIKKAGGNLATAGKDVTKNVTDFAVKPAQALRKGNRII
jgi:hypothetical protein